MPPPSPNSLDVVLHCHLDNQVNVSIVIIIGTTLDSAYRVGKLDIFGIGLQVFRGDQNNKLDDFFVEECFI